MYPYLREEGSQNDEIETASGGNVFAKEGLLSFTISRIMLTDWWPEPSILSLGIRLSQRRSLKFALVNLDDSRYDFYDTYGPE